MNRLLNYYSDYTCNQISDVEEDRPCVIDQQEHRRGTRQKQEVSRISTTSISRISYFYRPYSTLILPLTQPHAYKRSVKLVCVYLISHRIHISHRMLRYRAQIDGNLYRVSLEELQTRLVSGNCRDMKSLAEVLSIKAF